MAFYHAQAGGCCDCGDGDAWDPRGFCHKHGGACKSGDGATVYAGAEDGAVYAVGASDGAVKWRYATGAEVRSAPRLSKDGRLLFFGSSDGSVYALRAV